MAKPGKKRAPAKTWSMLGSVGFSLVVMGKDGVWGHRHPVIAWAWSKNGEVRAVVCLREGPHMLSAWEMKRAEYTQERLG